MANTIEGLANLYRIIGMEDTANSLEETAKLSVAQKGPKTLAELTERVEALLKEAQTTAKDLGRARQKNAGADLVLRSPKDQIQADLGLTPEQVARDPLEINPDTKAYVGSLVNGRDSDGKIVRVLERLTGVEHIYTAEGKRIPRWRLKIGEEGETADKLIRAVEDTITPDNNKMIVSDWSKSAIRTPKFVAALKSGPKTVDLIMLEVRDLGYTRGGTTTEVFGRGIDLGADLCDPRVGLYQRMADKDQKINDVYWIAMDPITGSLGFPGVFVLERNEDGTWLNSNWANPDNRWDPDYRIVFSLRK